MPVNGVGTDQYRSGLLEDKVRNAAETLSALLPFHGELPWRKYRTPYRIFLAEFLLIRTWTKAVATCFEDVYARFPTPDALATASLETVEDAVASLGLRKRAAYLLRAAQFILDEFDGRIPSDPEQLIRIPGIGPYTAVAISAFAFGGPLVPADVNILRFLSRLTGLPMKQKTKGSKQLRALLPLLSQNSRGPPAEILLDFTRLICKPRGPLCTECPLQEDCGGP